MILAPVDQRVRDAGFNFVPFNRFLASPFQIPQDDTITTDPNTGAGIVTLQPSVGGGGGTPFTGGIADLTSGFQTAVDDRQAKLTELNRPLTTFPSFPGPKTPGGFNAQRMYNKALADLNDPFNRLATTKTFSGTRPAIDVMNYADDIIDDYRMQYATGQLGPSVIREEPTIGRRIQDFIYSTPFFNKPQSADQIIQEGYEPQIKLGILQNILPDRFGTLPRGDQAFIQRNMGYTGPTVFGENTTGGAKDPFGLNVRSGFGNYAERVGVESEKLGDLLSGRMTEKYGKGTSGISFNTATGMFEAIDPDDPAAVNAALRATQMNKMNIAKYNYYTAKTKERDDDRAAAAAAQAAAERKFAAEGRSDPADTSRAGSFGRRPGSGGTVDRVTEGPGRNVDDTGQAYDSGGREGFGFGLADGGIVDMLEIYD